MKFLFLLFLISFECHESKTFPNSHDTVKPRVLLDYERKLIQSARVRISECKTLLSEEKCLQMFFNSPYFWDK